MCGTPTGLADDTSRKDFYNDKSGVENENSRLADNYVNENLLDKEKDQVPKQNTKGPRSILIIGSSLTIVILIIKIFILNPFGILYDNKKSIEDVHYATKEAAEDKHEKIDPKTVIAAYLSEIERQSEEYDRIDDVSRKRLNTSESDLKESRKKNTFAIADVDNDGVDELVVRQGSFGWEGDEGWIYGYNASENTLYTEGGGGSSFQLYNNGVLIDTYKWRSPLGDALHYVNEYNPQTDKYEFVLEYDTWLKDSYPEKYPKDIDAEGAGAVYFVVGAGEDGPDLLYGHPGEFDEAKYAHPISKSEFDKRVTNKYLSGKKLELEYFSVTDEGIEEYKKKNGYSGLVENDKRVYREFERIPDSTYWLKLSPMNTNGDNRSFIDGCSLSDDTLTIKGIMFSSAKGYEEIPYNKGSYLEAYAYKLRFNSKVELSHLSKNGKKEEYKSVSEFYDNLLRYQNSGYDLKLVIDQGELSCVEIYERTPEFYDKEAFTKLDDGDYWLMMTEKDARFDFPYVDNLVVKDHRLILKGTVIKALNGVVGSFGSSDPNQRYLRNITFELPISESLECYYAEPSKNNYMPRSKFIEDMKDYRKFGGLSVRFIVKNGELVSVSYYS